MSQFKPSQRTNAEWEKFFAQADWDRQSVFDVSQFVRFGVSAFKDGNFSMSAWCSGKLDKFQLNSELGIAILELSDWVHDTLTISQEMDEEVNNGRT